MQCDVVCHDCTRARGSSWSETAAGINRNCPLEHQRHDLPWARKPTRPCWDDRTTGADTWTPWTPNDTDTSLIIKLDGQQPSQFVVLDEVHEPVNEGEEPVGPGAVPAAGGTGTEAINAAVREELQL